MHPSELTTAVLNWNQLDSNSNNMLLTMNIPHMKNFIILKSLSRCKSWLRASLLVSYKTKRCSRWVVILKQKRIMWPKNSLRDKKGNLRTTTWGSLMSLSSLSWTMTTPGLIINLSTSLANCSRVSTLWQGISWMNITNKREKCLIQVCPRRGLIRLLVRFISEVDLNLAWNQMFPSSDSYLLWSDTNQNSLAKT